MHTKKDPTQKKKINLQQVYCIYLISNCILLLPTALIDLFRFLGEFLRSHLPHEVFIFCDYIFAAIILGPWILVIFYWILKLMYLHFAISLGFSVFSVYKLVKEKNTKLFLQILILTVISIALNIRWLMIGGGYCTV